MLGAFDWQLVAGVMRDHRGDGAKRLTELAQDVLSVDADDFHVHVALGAPVGRERCNERGVERVVQRGGFRDLEGEVKIIVYYWEYTNVAFYHAHIALLLKGSK